MRIHLGENARMALVTLREHKMRSFLTVLGVVIGITALVGVASIMVGLDRDIRAFLDDFGPNTLFVFKFSPGIHVGRLTQEERTRKPLTLEDALAIGEQCPSVKAVTAEVFPRVGTGQRSLPTARYHGKEVAGIEYNGTLAAYEQVYRQRMARGRFFTEAEDLHRADVAVIGFDLAEALFPNEDPLGKPILVNGVTYEVIGVAATIAGTTPPMTSTSSAHRPTREGRRPPRTRSAACCADAATSRSASRTLSASPAPNGSPTSSGRLPAQWLCCLLCSARSGC